MQVQANGITINCEVAGPEGAPVVTMSHSLAANLDMWRPQVEALKDRYRVVCYDTRGHGGSDAPDGDYSLDDLAEDTRQFLAALGIERTHFVGLSMGGMIGQVLAIKYPTMFRSLSLCDTSARIPPETGPAWDERVGIAREKGMAALVDTTVERWFTAPFRADGEAALEPVREMIRTTPAAGYAGCCAAIKRHDQLDRISAIDAPTLVVVGADDMGTPVAAAEAINQRIAGSRLVVLESAGHLSNIEQPAAFSAALADFIDGVEEQPMEKRHG